MKKIKFILILIIGLLAVAVITNPSHEKHKEKIWEKYQKQNPVSATLLGITDLKKSVLSMVTYENNYVYSLTFVSVDKEKKISFGAFGVVVVINLDLDQVM